MAQNRSWVDRGRGRLHRLSGRSGAPADAVERAEWKFYVNYLRPGMIVFDVGAHVGELSTLFARFVAPDGAVHAFEPVSENFRRLETAIVISRRRNLVLNHLAVADHEGEVELNVYDGEHSSWATMADRPLSEYGLEVSSISTETVRSTTIDSYCAEHQIDHVDLLKLDVEGAEYQVLLGARQLLSRGAIGCCIFEFGQTTFDMGVEPQEIRRYLRSLNYRIRNVISSDRPFPGGGSARTAVFSVHTAQR